MKKLTTFCLMTLMSISMFATPKYLVQTGKAGDPTWSQAVVEATGATVVDLAEGAGTTLDAFLSTSGDQKEVWIIEGLYAWSYECSKSRLTLYGGFAGTETSVDQRAKVANGKPWEFAHPTIISGANDQGEPYAHFTSNTGQAFTLDGITFTKFSNNGCTAPSTAWGGMCRIHGTAVVNACQFIDIHNYAGAGGVFKGYKDNGGVISNCLFENCTAGEVSSTTDIQGGVIVTAPEVGSINTINNCTFRACGVNHPGSNGGGAICSNGNGAVNVSNCVFDSCFVSALSGKGEGAAVYINSGQSGSKVYNNVFTRCTDSGNTKSLLYVGGGNAKDSVNMVSYIMHNTFVKNTNTGVAFRRNGNMICKNNIFFDIKDSKSGEVYLTAAGDYYKLFNNNIYIGGSMSGVQAANNQKLTASAVDDIFKDYANNNFMPKANISTWGDATVSTLVAGTSTDLLGETRVAYAPGCYEYIGVQSIALSAEEMFVVKGGKKKLSATILPVAAAQETITWKSLNTNIATVASGVVTAKAVGETKVVAEAGGKSDTCVIKVVNEGVPYLVQTGKVGDAVWSQASIDATHAAVIDLAAEGTTLDAFLSASGDQNEVWIIEGLYAWSYECSKSRLTLYGGFAGTETSVDQRAKVANGKPWEFAHSTIISGANDQGEPYAHFTNNTGQAFTLDGITFTKFSNNGCADPAAAWGGMCRIHGTAVVNACQFIDIHQYAGTGGVFRGYNDNGATISNCYFENCTAKTQGGAIFSSPAAAGTPNTIDKCAFRACGVTTPENNAGGAVYAQSTGALNLSNSIFDSCYVSALTGKGAGVAVYILSSQSKSKVYNNFFTRCTDNGNSKPILFVGGGNAKDSLTNVSYIMHNTFVKNTNTGVAFQSNGNLVCKNNIFYDLKESNPGNVYITKPDNYYKVFTNNIHIGGSMVGVQNYDNHKLTINDADSIFVDYANGNYMPKAGISTWGDATVAALVPGVATDLLGETRVAYAPGCYEAQMIYLYEDSDNTSSIIDQEDVAVRAYRTLSSASLNSICLPFALSAEQIEDAFGSNCRVLILSSAEETEGCIYLMFTDVTSMDANTPYLIQPASQVVNPLFKQVNMVKSNNQDLVRTAATMHGIYAPTPLTAGDQNQMFIGANNTLLIPSNNNPLKALRAYITLTPSTPNGVAVRLMIGEKGSVTEISTIDANEVKAMKIIRDNQFLIIRNNRMFNAQGQQL